MGMSTGMRDGFVSTAPHPGDHDARDPGCLLLRGAAVALTATAKVVGFVPPLDHLAVREVSARYLSQDERFQIADL